MATPSYLRSPLAGVALALLAGIFFAVIALVLFGRIL
jgi:hypothetical protein